MKLCELLPVIREDNRLWIYTTNVNTGAVVMGGANFDELPEHERQRLSACEVVEIHSMINHGILGVELHTTEEPQPVTPKRWRLTASRDGNGVDFETVITSEDEPEWWTCYDLAAAHGCDWFDVVEVVEE